MKKYRYNNTDVYVAEQENYKIGLGQVAKPTLPTSIYYGTYKPAVAINGSYFHSGSDGTWAVGRNQGDSYNERPDKAGWCLVHDKDGWHCGEFKSWEYIDDVDLGLSAATVLIKDGADVELCSTEIISDAKSKLTTLAPQTALAVTNDNKAILVVCDGRSTENKGLSGRTLRTFLKSKYDNIKYLVQLDGGGSSQMVVDGKIVNEPSDGSPRKVLNAVCLYGDNIPEPEPQKAILSFNNGSGNMLSGITQKEGVGSHIKNLANDFNGTCAKDQVYLRAPYDCIVRAVATYDNTAFFESLGKVITPSGTYDRCFFMCTHMLDEDLEDLGVAVGKTFKQGEICFREGTKGIGSGNHIHMECGTGVFNGTTKPYKDSGDTFIYNGKTYKLFVPCTSGNEKSVYDMMYLDNLDTETNIKSIYNWTYSDSKLPVPVEYDITKNQVEVVIEKLRVRSTPDSSTKTNILGYCPLGFFNVVEKLDCWYKLEGETNFYIAHIEGGTEYHEGLIWTKPEPVDRDTSVDQVEVLVDNLRIRYEASTEATNMGLADMGFYNVQQIIDGEDYRWYKIGDHAFIANIEGCVTYLQKDDSEEVKKLKEQLAQAKAEIKELKVEVKDLNAKLNESEEQIKKLNETISEKEAIIIKDESKLSELKRHVDEMSKIF